MSFWPLCCKSPQAYPIAREVFRLEGQFPIRYPAADPIKPAGRPPHADSLGVAGSRSGRVVDNPIKWKSLCDVAGVSEEGGLYVWGGAAATAAWYRNTPAGALERVYDSSLDFDRDIGFGGLFRIGTDSDWKSVASPPSGSTANSGMILAIKEDGTLWTLGDWQSGVDCDWGSEDANYLTPSIARQSFRAVLSSPIERIETEFAQGDSNDGDRFARYWFGLPVWFTADPGRATAVQKLRIRHKDASGIVGAEVSLASSEPGDGATVSANFVAKINDGGILGGTASGSGLFPSAWYRVSVNGHGDSGEGALVYAIAGSSGSLESILVLNPGSGYRNPVTASIASPLGSVSIDPTLSVRVASPGSGYRTVPKITVTPHPEDDQDASGAVIAVTQMSKCGVGSFAVTSGGSGYSEATAREMRTGATAAAVINEDGVIVGWSLTSAGSPVYSPLDDDPLLVEVTGDGDGAQAEAVPAGSLIEKVELTSNPEVWTRIPSVQVTDGGGAGAQVVIEGIVGQVSLTVDNGGSGYTRTSRHSASWPARTGFAFDASAVAWRSHYCPCVTLPLQHAVGGRRTSGRVIVGEAVLAPSEITQVKKDAAEYVNPHWSPYRTEDSLSFYSYTPPEDTQKRFQFKESLLTVASQGVVNPFEGFISGSDAMAVGNFLSSEDREECVSQCFRAYIRGPGHSRHQVNIEDASVEDAYLDRYKISVPNAIPMPQPPSLSVEVSARPHNLRFTGQETTSSVPVPPGASSRLYYSELWYTEPIPGAKEWWAIATGSGNYVGDTRRAHFIPGDVVVTGRFGSRTTYKIINGVLAAPQREQAMGPLVPPFTDQPTATVSAPNEYRGPLLEEEYSDPVVSWSQPSLPQRIHFVYPTECDFSATAIAEAVIDPSAGHPTIGLITLTENGKYTAEPEPLIFRASDPVPVDSGLTGCTSAGFGMDGQVFAHANGNLMWWGRNTAIVSSGIDRVYGINDNVEDATDAKEVYEQGLKTAGIRRQNFTAKPTLVGGHLRIETSGELVFFTDQVLAEWHRAPRPTYGNRVASFVPSVDALAGQFFSNSPSQIYVPEQLVMLSPGTQSGPLYRYKPWQTPQCDQGVGYEASASFEYRGPGLSPHTFAIQAQVVPNRIASVGRNGLLKDVDGKWRRPPKYTALGGFDVYLYADALPRPLTLRTVRISAGQTATYTVTETGTIQVSRYIAAVRSAGAGYNWADELRVSGTDVGVRIVTSSSGDGSSGNFVEEYKYEKATTPGGHPYLSLSGFLPQRVFFNDNRLSSYGGLTRPYYVSFGGEASGAAATAQVLGGGQGATADVVDYPSQRPSPFSLFCLDADISSTVEPVYFDTANAVYGMAVTNTGAARVVIDRLMFAPEAFVGLPPVSGLSLLPAVGILFPYSDEVTPTPIAAARDVNGVLWAVRFGPVGFSRFGLVRTVHLMSSATGEPAKPLAFAPLAIALTNTGDGYDSPPAVSVTQPAGVATGSVTIDGKVVGVSVVDGGSGYETPPSVAVGGVAAQVEIAGPVWGIKVDNGGSGYRCPPTVRFSAGGLPATATAVIQDGEVTSVKVVDGGEYRQSPQVFFDADKDIERIDVGSGGSGYATPPAVTIAGGGGSGGSATAKISCSVTEFVLTSSGAGYTVTPLVEVIASGPGDGANGRAVLDMATGMVSRIEVTSPGSGYEKPPQVRIVSADGQGGGASAIAKIEGFVSEVTLVTRGSRYREPPKVIISGGGGRDARATAVIAAVGSGAAATARINGSVVTVTATGGSGLQKPPPVFCTRNPSPADGPPKTDAVLKSIILGRPTSVTVVNGGTDYSSPYYDDDQIANAGSQSENIRKSPSRSVRRTPVSGKGSFCLNGRGLRTFSGTTASNRARGPMPVTKSGLLYSYDRYRDAWGWPNTLPFLGVASLSGETKDGGGSVASVSLPKFVVRLRVTNGGTGYTPNSYLSIRFKGGGVRDSRFRVFWENENSRQQPTVGGVLDSDSYVAARAYVNGEGVVSGVVYEAGYDYYVSSTDFFGFPAGFVAYTSPPAFEVEVFNAPGSGATVVGELDHPLECYYAPQALFDGHIETECDTALTLAGAVVEGSSELMCACVGRGQENPIWLGKLDPSRIVSTKLFQEAISSDSYQSDVPPPVQLSLAGELAGYSPIKRFSDWTDEDKEYFEKPVAFFSPSDPPQVFIEDVSGAGVTVTAAELPASGAVSAKWLGESRITSGGQGCTLGARLRLRGGVPLARVQPASATATVAGSGRVRSLTLTTGGKGYTTPPAVFIVGDGVGAEAVVDKSGIDKDTGELKWIRLLRGGQGYTTAEVVIVDREPVAEESTGVKEMLSFVGERYSAVLTNAKVTKASVPPQRRRQATTMAVRQITQTSGAVNEVSLFSPGGYSDDYSEVGRYYRDYIRPELEASGYRLHPVFLSDGYCEYARVEHHFGHAPASQPSVTISTTSDTTPSVQASAIAVIPKVGPLFSGTVADVTTGGADFPPTQFD